MRAAALFALEPGAAPEPARAGACPSVGSGAAGACRSGTVSTNVPSRAPPEKPLAGLARSRSGAESRREPTFKPGCRAHLVVQGGGEEAVREQLQKLGAEYGHVHARHALRPRAHPRPRRSTAAERAGS